MHLETRDTLMKKMLDAQENVRDFESISKRIDDEEVISAFKEFAEQSGHQARRLKELLSKYEHK